MKKISWSMLLITLFLSAPVGAMERFDIVTTQELEEMLAQRSAGKIDFILVNALDEIIYRDSAIPGSVNAPWYKVAEVSHRLGIDKDRMIITY